MDLASWYAVIVPKFVRLVDRYCHSPESPVPVPSLDCFDQNRWNNLVGSQQLLCSTNALNDAAHS